MACRERVACAGLNDKRLARRTLVANDGKGHWALMATSAGNFGRCGENSLPERDRRPMDGRECFEPRRRLFDGPSCRGGRRSLDRHWPPLDQCEITSPSSPAGDSFAPDYSSLAGCSQFHYFSGMQIHLSPRHLTLTAAIYAYVADKISHLEQMTDRILAAHVVLLHDETKTKKHIVKVHLAVPGPDIYAEHAEDDLYAAIDKVTGKLSQQLRKAQDPHRRSQEAPLASGQRREEKRVQAPVEASPRWTTRSNSRSLKGRSIFCSI